MAKPNKVNRVLQNTMETEFVVQLEPRHLQLIYISKLAIAGLRLGKTCRLSSHVGKELDMLREAKATLSRYRLKRRAKPFVGPAMAKFNARVNNFIETSINRAISHGYQLGVASTIAGRPHGLKTSQLTARIERGMWPCRSVSNPHADCQCAECKIDAVGSINGFVVHKSARSWRVH